MDLYFENPANVIISNQLLEFNPKKKKKRDFPAKWSKDKESRMDSFFFKI